MTSKGFDALAKAMRSTKPDRNNIKAWSQWQNDLLAIANVLEGDNPNFNGGLFMANCGVFS